MTQLINERASANETIEETTQENRERSERVFLTTNEVVLMQTARAPVCNKNDSTMCDVRMLLDLGSQRTNITESLSKKSD